MQKDRYLRAASADKPAPLGLTSLQVQPLTVYTARSGFWWHAGSVELRGRARRRICAAPLIIEGTEKADRVAAGGAS